ncbi:flavodoxin FldA [Halosquirtibacter laminarini]|uniref:Flavodoxin FldA n=1 Tax=Halosquirtibacter laminarini TaxID=3374600 RepID=A0AC61NBL6_9BACT|nr:flavodoxin FldA [Prolixibacteraceae bacterium]
MGKTAIIYGSTTGNTESVADLIAEKIEGATVLSVGDFDPSDVDSYDNLILGTSTWGAGDLQDDWEEKLDDIASASFEGKVVAFYGLGDSDSYADTFVDGMGKIYDAIKDSGATVVGSVAADGYSYDESEAVVDGKFVGLPLDQDNEEDQTEGRISAWVESFLSLLK